MSSMALLRRKQAEMNIQTSICMDMCGMVIFADPYYDLPVRRLAWVGLSTPVVPNIYSFNKKGSMKRLLFSLLAVAFGMTQALARAGASRAR
jgi:hypothetical protein